jgi:hypothetical protein
LFSEFLRFFCILIGFYPFIGFILFFWVIPDLWVISCLGFSLFFVGSASGVWFNKPVFILLWFGVFRFLFFIKREFLDQMNMFMAPSTSEGDLLIIDVLDPFLIPEFETYYWLWSLIIFLIQRSLLSAVIPHEVFTPLKYVHSSMQGSEEGGYPLYGVRGGLSPRLGGLGASGPPEKKLPCKSIL